jgi:hypothetical protein
MNALTSYLRNMTLWRMLQRVAAAALLAAALAGSARLASAAAPRIASSITASSTITSSAAASMERTASDSLSEQLGRLSPMGVDEVVWLARCIYSESDRPHEQRLVAWVVRNRVETGYRGRTYRDVILETRQFSAFNAPSPRRARILNLTPASTFGPWRTALQIALDVYEAPAAERPFPQTVRHFYSPISMRGALAPHWADSGTEVSTTALGVDPHRFRFFSGVDENVEAELAASNGAAPDRVERTKAGRGGFLFPVGSSSGRVARPRRPAVRSSADR